MRRETLGYLLALSVLFNLGAVVATAWQVHRGSGEEPAEIPQVLRLDVAQSQRWKELERSFVAELDAQWREIGREREALIRQVFAATPDARAVEASRARIAALQADQQRRVIEQLLREKELLTPGQREELMKLLLRQRVPTADERRLHGGETTTPERR